jgi:hypothetical protein
MSLDIPVKLWHIATSHILMFVLAFLVGLVIFGWWLWPVQWEPSKLNDAPYYSQVTYVHLVSEWYAYTEDTTRVQMYLGELDNAADIACTLADGETTDLPRKARYIKVAYLKNGHGCR